MAIPLDLQLRSLRRKIESLFSGYATTVHTHAQSDITGLVAGAGNTTVLAGSYITYSIVS
jgi:hypothetical protein